MRSFARLGSVLSVGYAVQIRGNISSARSVAIEHALSAIETTNLGGELTVSRSAWLNRDLTVKGMAFIESNISVMGDSASEKCVTTKEDLIVAGGVKGGSFAGFEGALYVNAAVELGSTCRIDKELTVGSSISAARDGFDTLAEKWEVSCKTVCLCIGGGISVKNG